MPDTIVIHVPIDHHKLPVFSCFILPVFLFKKHYYFYYYYYGSMVQELLRNYNPCVGVIK